MYALPGAETRKWQALRANPELSAAERDTALRSYCVDEAEAAWAATASTRPPSWDARLVMPEELLSVLCLLPIPQAGAPIVEERLAWAAIVAAVVGPRLNLETLAYKYGTPHGGVLVAGSFGGGGVSAAVQWGSSLVVGVTELMGRPWQHWVDVFAAPLTKVDTRRLVQAGSPTPPGLPLDFCVLAEPWAAATAQQGFLRNVRQALDGAGTRSRVTRIIFCGHGLGAAVALLLALRFHLRYPASEAAPVELSVVTFGCPTVGDAALQEALRLLPTHRRFYVAHDPVAGLPRWSCTGLRFSDAAQQVAPTTASAHLALWLGGRARLGSSAAPRVPSLSVAGLAFRSHHSLQAYALCLSAHLRAVILAPGGEGGTENTDDQGRDRPPGNSTMDGGGSPGSGAANTAASS